MTALKSKSVQTKVARFHIQKFRGFFALSCGIIFSGGTFLWHFVDAFFHLAAREDILLPDPDQNFFALLEPESSRALLDAPPPNALVAITVWQLLEPDSVLEIITKSWPGFFIPPVDRRSFSPAGRSSNRLRRWLHPDPLSDPNRA